MIWKLKKKKMENGREKINYLKKYKLLNPIFFPLIDISFNNQENLIYTSFLSYQICITDI